jgi:hypothetical protein
MYVCMYVCMKAWPYQANVRLVSYERHNCLNLKTEFVMMLLFHSGRYEISPV